MKFGFRLSFPEDSPLTFTTRIRGLSEDVELAFKDPSKFMTIDLDQIIKAFDGFEAHVASIHLPHVRVTETEQFREVLEKSTKLARALRCDILVVHPSRAKMSNAIESLLKEVASTLEADGLTLAWETFSGKWRLFNKLEQIADLSRSYGEVYGICYDTSHVQGDTDEVIGELGEYIEFIKIIHASNRTLDHKRQHLPVFSSEGILDFYKIFSALNEIGYNRHVILEYLQEYHPQIQQDLKELRRLF